MRQKRTKREPAAAAMALAMTALLLLGGTLGCLAAPAPKKPPRRLSPQEMAPKFRRGLKSEKVKTRQVMAVVLSRIKRQDRAFYLVAREALRHEKHPRVIKPLLSALHQHARGTADDAEGQRILSAYLAHADRGVRKQAAVLSFLFKKMTLPLRNGLKKCLRNEKQDTIRLYCAMPLARENAHLDLAVPAILKGALHRETQDLALTAISAMGDAALPEYKKLIRGRDPELITLALGGIGRSKVGPAQVIPDLKRLLRHHDAGVRLFTVKLLGMAGPGAKRLLPRLKRMRETEKDREVLAEIQNTIALLEK